MQTDREKRRSEHLKNPLLAILSILLGLLLLLFLLGLLALRLLLGGLALVLALALLFLLLPNRRGSGGSGSGFSSLDRGGRGSSLLGGSLSALLGLRVILVAGLPGGGGVLIGAAILVKLAIRLQLLLLNGSRAETPAAGVKVALHDAALDLGDDAVVAGRHLDSAHLRNTNSNSLTLGGDENNLLVHINVLGVSQQTGQRELGTVADGVDSGILNNETLVSAQESLQGMDNLAKEGFVTAVVVGPLGIENIVKRDKLAIVLRHDTGADTAKLLHVSANTEEKTKVNAESTDVGAGLARHPEDTKVAVIVELNELALVDGTDTELTLDGRNKRGPLEKSTSEGLEGLSEGSLATRDLVVETDHANVLLTSALLGLDETSSAINADNCFPTMLVTLPPPIQSHRAFFSNLLKQPVTLGSRVPE